MARSPLPISSRPSLTYPHGIHVTPRAVYKTTGWLFDEFVHSERRLGESGSLWPGVSGSSYAASASTPNSKTPSFFVPRDSPGGQTFLGAIEDDHIPFVHRGVPVVHLIATPFPPVWHTIRDDASALDLPTIKAWALIVRLTVAEYLGLDPELGSRARRGKGELVSRPFNAFPPTDGVC